MTPIQLLLLLEVKWKILKSKRLTSSPYRRCAVLLDLSSDLMLGYQILLSKEYRRYFVTRVFVDCSEKNDMGKCVITFFGTIFSRCTLVYILWNERDVLHELERFLANALDGMDNSISEIFEH